MIYPDFRVSSSDMDTFTALLQEKVPLFFFISASRLGKGQLNHSWNENRAANRSLDPRGYKEAEHCCGACLNAANKSKCPFLCRANRPHWSQPSSDFVNSWPKSAFRCSQTIPISFRSWLVNTNRIAPFLHNRNHSCIYPSCGETVICEKSSTRWHYISVHLFPYYYILTILFISILFPGTAGAFSQPNQTLPSLANRHWLHCKATPLKECHSSNQYEVYTKNNRS